MFQTSQLASINVNPVVEFDRQRKSLIDLGYPKRAGLSRPEFDDLLGPLRNASSKLELSPRVGNSRLPFVIVIPQELVDAESVIETLRLAGSDRVGVLDRNHGPQGLSGYHPIHGLEVAESPYLLVDIQRGEEFCGLRPQDAIETIASRDRTPLTINEGIALQTHFPELLEKNKCYMLGGSTRGDRRVPAIWISDRAPKLGWCWRGNPHTWLGVASAARRVNVV